MIDVHLLANQLVIRWIINNSRRRCGIVRTETENREGIRLGDYNGCGQLQDLLHSC